MRQRSYTRRRSIRRVAPPSAEDTRRQLAGILVALFGLCCAMAPFAPDSSTIDKLLPFLTQQLALVVGYYFGQKAR
jgi:hypothetical protein